jgi:hypothetical protein
MHGMENDRNFENLLCTNGLIFFSKIFVFKHHSIEQVKLTRRIFDQA